MMDPFEIVVGPEGLGFAAAHFISWEDGSCEPLHGHNYRVRVRLSGRPNEAGYVHDFVALGAAVEELLGELDHRVLLPDGSGRIAVERDGDRIRVRCGEREHRFPADEVRILPIDNTTSERLAAHLADRLAERLVEGNTGPGRLVVELEESPGRAARHARELR